MDKLQWRRVKTTGPRKSRCDAEAIKRHQKVLLHAGGENDGWWGGQERLMGTKRKLFDEIVLS